jgi:hypothetical protein
MLLPRSFVIVAYTALVIAQSLSLHVLIRRYVTGYEVSAVNLNNGVQWWRSNGFSPMTTWLIGTVGFAFVALAFFYNGSRRLAIVDEPSIVAHPGPVDAPHRGSAAHHGIVSHHRRAFNPHMPSTPLGAMDGERHGKHSTPDPDGIPTSPNTLDAVPNKPKTTAT